MEAEMSLWVTILAAGLVTFAIRLSFIYLLEKVNMPDWFRRALRFVPAAVLSAIILPELVSPNGSMDISFHNPQLLAGFIAVLVAWRTRNMLLTIAAGMLSLLALQLVVGLT
jgi:branched-subunit amino acid transport protein